jgi:hypothetical protein
VRSDRLALFATLALLAINLATTGRWTDVPGALHGWRLPYVAAGLIVAAFFGLRAEAPGSRVLPWLPPATFVAGGLLLVGLFACVWPRFQSTVEGVRLLRHGTFAGWRWPLLGGYAIGTDLNQSLTLIGALPMFVFGNAVGYHVVHLLLFLSLPALVFWDLGRTESRKLAWLSAGFVALSGAGAAWNFMRSGDTNSLAGLVGVAAVVTASQYASTRGRYGMTALVLAVALTAYSNVSYVPYAVALLLLEAAYYRDWQRLRRGGVALVLAGIMSLPATYELLRYPQEFVVNNMSFEPESGINIGRAMRKIFYHVQIHFQPSRWLNDPIGITSLFFPLVLVAAWRREGRAGYYAWGALFVDGLIRLTINEVGATFSRSFHLLIVLTPVALAWFVVSRSWNRGLAVALTVVVGLCFQITGISVAHISSLAAFLPSLVDRIRAVDDRRVLVENNPHRDTDATPEARTEPSLYGIHYEALVPEATGKLLYAGYWDGWQFTRFNGEMLAGGGWQGRVLAEGDRTAFVDEMRRWGVRHLFVWSKTATARLSAWPEFSRVWRADPWSEYELIDPRADSRLVVTSHGEAELTSTNPLGGVVRLVDANAGDLVVVRTHFHPAWAVDWSGRSIPATNTGGQLSFVAPTTGSYDVTLVYPPRRWLLICPLLAAVVGVLVDRFRTPDHAKAG